jgi:histidinol dehydrogenase
VDGAEALLPLVRRAGAVFVGPYAPASVGDYVAGPNHVLPTARTARFASALGVEDFRTGIHAVAVDRDGLAALAPAVTAIADIEGLGAHADSVRLRVEG